MAGLGFAIPWRRACGRAQQGGYVRGAVLLKTEFATGLHCKTMQGLALHQTQHNSRTYQYTTGTAYGTQDLTCPFRM